MPEQLNPYSLTPEQWRKFAAFHTRAAGIMAAAAMALEAGDRARYHEAMTEFSELAETQRGGGNIYEYLCN